MDYISHPPLPLPSSKASTDIGRIESHSGTEAIQPTILRALAMNGLKAQGPLRKWTPNTELQNRSRYIVPILVQCWPQYGSGNLDELGYRCLATANWPIIPSRDLVPDRA